MVALSTNVRHWPCAVVWGSARKFEFRISVVHAAAAGSSMAAASRKTYFPPKPHFSFLLNNWSILSLAALFASAHSLSRSLFAQYSNIIWISCVFFAGFYFSLHSLAIRCVCKWLECVCMNVIRLQPSAHYVFMGTERRKFGAHDDERSAGRHSSSSSSSTTTRRKRSAAKKVAVER